MNKIRIVNFIILLLCLFTVNIYGQRKEISAEQFTDLKDKATKKTGKTSHRVINERLLYTTDGKKIQQLENISTEFLPTGRTRTISKVINYEINRSVDQEYITIDKVTFRRVDGGEWRIFDEKKITRPNKNFEIEQKSRKYYLTENVNFESQTLDLIEFEEEYISKFTNPRTGKIIETELHQIWKFWIGKDRLMLRGELISEKSSPKMLAVRGVWNYEYDPNIKIEAPIK